MVEENMLFCPASLLNLTDFNHIFTCQPSTEVIVFQADSLEVFWSFITWKHSQVEENHFTSWFLFDSCCFSTSSV